MLGKLVFCCWWFQSIYLKTGIILCDASASQMHACEHAHTHILLSCVLHSLLTTHVCSSGFNLFSTPKSELFGLVYFKIFNDSGD